MAYGTKNKQPNTVLFGALVAAMGVAVAVLMNLRPDGLAVPYWVAMLACLCFVFAGIALATQDRSSKILYQSAVLALLAAMTAIPAWISFGPGDRQCSANLVFLTGEPACRIAFGLSTLVMLLVLAIAVKQTWRLIRAR
jgi:sulfite exporter TauE/SafE